MKNRRVKGFYLLLSSVFLTLLQLPFSIAKSAAGSKMHIKTSVHDSDAVKRVLTSEVISENRSVYDSLHLSLIGLSKEAYEYAKQGLEYLIEKGEKLSSTVISIIDFSLPSNKKRLFIIDLENYRLLFNTYVAHGRNTGREWATSFSNQSQSYKSSPGFYKTAETYQGKNGYSLKLEGLERGINDNAYDRGIVIHGAEYVSQSLANVQGYIGRSQGCPAVPVQESRPIINTIKDGSVVFIYHPSYISRSSLLN